MKNKPNKVTEIQIVSGYDIDELLDTTDNDYFDEEPLKTEEVIVIIE